MEDIQIYFAKEVVIPVSPDTDDSYLEMRSDMDPKPEAIDND